MARPPELVRDALVQVLSSCKSASIGWRLGELFHHLMECKHAISTASKAGRKVAVDFLFGETKKPDTHRQCTIHMHDRNFEISTQNLQLNSLDLSKHFAAWRKDTRQEAAAKGISFQPGTSLQHVLVGKVSEVDSTSFATAVHMHFLNPSNPELYNTLFKFFKLLFKAAHELHHRGEGDQVLAACSAMMPRGSQVMKDVIEDANYRITDSGVAGVLKHCFTCRWNLKAIRKRFGEDQYHIFRDRPMYDWRLESATDSELLALTLRETENHKVEISFLVSESGKLVWSDSTSRPQQGEVPSFWVGAFTVRVTNLRLPMACCGCLGTAHLPPLCFALEAFREPHPMFRVSCKEMGHFPMEWFYSPLFDMAHMRSLLVRHLCVECHFLGDECHLHVHFQLSRLSSILKRALKVFSSRVLDIFFGAVHEDPPVVLLAALGEDFCHLEDEL